MTQSKVLPSTSSCLNPQTIMPRLFAAVLVLVICAFAAGARAQSADRVPQSFDPAPAVVLKGHHPQWAVAANDVGAIDPNKSFENVTVTLARSPEAQKAFDQLVDDQRNPKSPQFHQWLTPIEIGARYGVSDHDIAQVSGWLESQGLHENVVSSTRTFISFGGAASSLERAFGAPLHNYKVAGEDRFSIVSEPMVPPALAPVILSIRGLSTAPERPQHVSRQGHFQRPQWTYSAGSEYFVAPADFAAIYDVPTSLSGSGVTIGIVGEARVSSADITDMNSLMGTSIGTPTEVIPTAYGGVDPGAAITSEPSCYASNTCSAAVNDYLDAQGEATLDEERSGSVAQGASILLVTASSASGGIADDAEYLTETAGPPAQIMSISFGGCEANATGAVAGWSSLYETAAAEGISVFVSSGDSGAAGCDAHGGAPPATPGVVSPNFLCSPIYETCVGGTEFNDAGDYSAYWSSSNGAGLKSALGYIPEGAWNDPGSSGAYSVGATGGGVSSVIPTPSWQTGTGVPAARAGRYTPDVSFTASADHDGYLVCMAAIGGDCGSGYLEVFGGTSASAPDMAGVTALLDQSEGSAQGNITPNIYALAASHPSAFHDVTVSSSGVSGCAVTTPSMCNNSIPAQTTLTGGTQGFLVQAGFDEATGWGSLDVAKFIQYYGAAPAPTTPTVTVTPTASSITFSEAVTVNVTVSGSSGTPTGSVKLTSGSYTSSAVTLSSGSAGINVPGTSLALGTDTLTVTYTPDSGSSSIYTSASGTATETVSQATQTINFATIPSQTYGEAPFTVSATASSGLTVSFASTTSTVCTVSGHTVTLVNHGTCSIEATQTGNADYSAAAPVTRSFGVSKEAQTITFGTLPGKTLGAAPFTVSATASSGLAVSFASTTPTVCTVSGSTVTLVAHGACSIEATQAGNNYFAAATAVTRSFAVSKEAQTITFGTLPAKTLGAAPFTVSATATSGLAVSFASTTTSVCTVSGNTVTLVAHGACSIEATQAGNANFAAATAVTRSFAVSKEAQTITFGALSMKPYGAAAFPVRASATAGLAVSFASTTPTVCTVSGDTVTLVAHGTCSVEASQAGNTVFAAAAPFEALV